MEPEIYTTDYWKYQPDKSTLIKTCLSLVHDKHPDYSLWHVRVIPQGSHFSVELPNDDYRPILLCMLPGSDYPIWRMEPVEDEPEWAEQTQFEYEQAMALAKAVLGNQRVLGKSLQNHVDQEPDYLDWTV